MLVNKQEYIIPPNNYGPLNSKVYNEGMEFADKFCKILSDVYAEELSSKKYQTSIYSPDVQDFKYKIEIECKQDFEHRLKQFLSGGSDAFLNDFIDYLKNDSAMIVEFIEKIPFRYDIFEYDEIHRQTVDKAKNRFYDVIKVDKDTDKAFKDFYRDYHDLKEQESKL